MQFVVRVQDPGERALVCQSANKDRFDTSILCNPLLDVHPLQPIRVVALDIAANCAIGVALALLAHGMTGTYWPWIAAMLLVAFAGTFAMKWGMRAYMVGWCSICWFYCTALLGASEDLDGLILLFSIFTPAQQEQLEAATEPEPASSPPGTRTVFEYSLAVGIAMAIGLVAGDLWLSTDPTLILNATLMVIFSSLAQTRTLAVDWPIGALLGIIFGFYLGLWVQHPWMEPAAWLVFSFFIMALLNVNAGVVTFFFLALFAVGCGTQGYEAGNAIANERILAEFAGVAIAVIAVAARDMLGRASG
jgi:hypothetical protein